MKILTILGARPQFIKAGSVSREIAKHKNLQEVIVHTGQHYDTNMSDVFFEQMKIPTPNYFLGIGGKSHAAMTGQMMEKIEEVAVKEKPSLILVYGDTNSTLAGALVAAKLHIPLAHIEAGLRSFNMHMPEEVNRILTDRVSSLLFCPTETAVQNLKREGFDNFECTVVESGDVMQDGALFYKDFSQKPNYKIKNNFILCTIHRAENTDNKERLANIFQALRVIAQKKQVILPLHPRTKKILATLNISTKNLDLIEPMGYLEMVWLIDHCDLVMTDSGGLQKEAFFFKKPCITLRDETEWIELVKNKFNILVGADTQKIIDTHNNINFLFASTYDMNLYGKGNASKKIIEALVHFDQSSIILKT